MERKTNTCAVVGFILSFFCGLAGLIVSIIALSQIKKTGEKGKGLAIAGIILTCFSIIVPILIGIFYMVFVMPGLRGSIESGTVCAYGANYNVGYYGEDGYIDCDDADYKGDYLCTYTNSNGYVVTITCEG